MNNCITTTINKNSFQLNILAYDVMQFNTDILAYRHRCLFTTIFDNVDDTGGPVVDWSSHSIWRKP